MVYKIYLCDLVTEKMFYFYYDETTINFRKRCSMKKNKWMFLAMLLGAVFFLAVWVIKPIGVSTQFSVFSGIVHSTIDRSVITEEAGRDSGYGSKIAYYDKDGGKLAKSIKSPLNYDFIFVLAIPLGAYAGYLIKRRKNAVSAMGEDTAEEVQAEKRKGWKRYLPSFIGGFLLLYGARMADGCTSGHMMSGMMQGAVSGYIFAAFVFAAAIPTAILAGRRFRTKGGE